LTGSYPNVSTDSYNIYLGSLIGLQIIPDALLETTVQTRYCRKNTDIILTLNSVRYITEQY